MPQISLYIDSDTLKKITNRAKREGQSISKWVKSRISESIEKDWPADYFSLFGSIDDKSFDRPSQGKLNDNANRQSL